MAKHIFFFAAVALVVLVQQNDGAATKVRDDLGVIRSVMDKYITKATDALKSSANFHDISQNYDSKMKTINDFINAINLRFYLIYTRFADKIKESNDEKLDLCNKAINTFLETNKNFNKLMDDCALPLKKAAQFNLDEIENIRKNFDYKLAALKEENEKCKSSENSSDVLLCGTKIVTEAIDLREKTVPLNMKIQQLDGQLDSMFVKIDFCHSKNAISTLGKEFYAHAALVHKCLKK